MANPFGVGWEKIIYSLIRSKFKIVISKQP